MDFSDLLISGRPLKVMCRIKPYTVPDSDLSDWTVNELLDYWKGSSLWYIEVFP